MLVSSNFWRQTQAVRKNLSRIRWRKRLVGLALVILIWTLGGWVAAQGGLSQRQLEQAAYVRACGSCHIPLPAEVLPRDTWRRLVQDPNHYGQQISPLTGADLQLAWGYLSADARRLREFEPVPYRLRESRYFLAQHPDVPLPDPVRVTSCIDCHPRVNLGDFVTLAPEWFGTPG